MEFDTGCLIFIFNLLLYSDRLHMKKRNDLLWTVLVFICFVCCYSPSMAQRQLEALNRGVVAIRSTEKDVFISWRLLGNEPPHIAFNIYRVNGAKAPVQLNTTPLIKSTCFTDSLANFTINNTY